MQCPAKLFYTGKPAYHNRKSEDSFLQALAEGGFQVGELAKQYFPGGHDLESLSADRALSRTRELLQQERVTIYEATVATDSLLVRADVLVKSGGRLDLYEVKAKSFDKDKDHPLIGRNGRIKASWRIYVYDVAFQKFVINKALPGYSVRAHLLVVDKAATCVTDGLNQKFRVSRDGKGRKNVRIVSSLNKRDFEDGLLREVNVDEECESIYAGNDNDAPLPMTFEERVSSFAKAYASDTKIESPISTQCASCEFDTDPTNQASELLSGKRECWRTQLPTWTDADFEAPTVLDLWNFRGKAALIDESRIKLSAIKEEDIDPRPDDKPGLSTSERQWMQVEKHQRGDDSVWIDHENLIREMDKWVYPLHFIDFETAMPAIPFNRGRRPYEGLAFQFSHHVVHEDGFIEHKGEWLHKERGEFPNFDFVRALKEALGDDNGTVFRYADHENSYLNIIYQQLRNASSEIRDSDELCDFIKTITQSGKRGSEQWTGERNMVDMLQLVKRFHYDPGTNGSNSIKAVMPAMLRRSDFLQSKYSKPIYGASNGIPSHNFSNWQWVKYNDGAVTDPYKLLPKMFQDVPDDAVQLLSTGDELSDGGAAMTAYARLQFEELSAYERTEIHQALLKYCELDTMAMVMLYEGWKDLLYGHS